VLSDRTTRKGGGKTWEEVNRPALVAAIVDYLTIAGRIETIQDSDPLWVGHDPIKLPTNQPLTSHAFVHSLKKYAQAAGLGDIHLHQTRHTFARWVSEESGSIADTQAALDHADSKTTRVYVKQIALKKDRYTTAISKRLGV
jgi:integrase